MIRTIGVITIVHLSDAITTSTTGRMSCSVTVLQLNTFENVFDSDFINRTQLKTDIGQRMWEMLDIPISQLVRVDGEKVTEYRFINSKPRECMTWKLLEAQRVDNESMYVDLVTDEDNPTMHRIVNGQIHWHENLMRHINSNDAINTVEKKRRQ